MHAQWCQSLQPPCVRHWVSQRDSSAPRAPLVRPPQTAAHALRPPPESVQHMAMHHARIHNFGQLVPGTTETATNLQNCTAGQAATCAAAQQSAPPPANRLATRTTMVTAWLETLLNRCWSIPHLQRMTLATRQRMRLQRTPRRQRAASPALPGSPRAATQSQLWRRLVRH